MKKIKLLVNTGYSLGISLLLASAIYFFTSNWALLNRGEKLASSIALTVVLYALAWLFSALWTRVTLGEMALFAGCVSFGITLALIGQIYNSHADDWLLYFIWFIPAILFSFFVRYSPFYVLSYLLLHCTLGFAFFPTSESTNYGEAEMLGIFLFFTVVNLAIIWLSERREINSAVLKFVAYWAAFGMLLAMTNSFVYEQYGPAANVLCVLFLAGSFYRNIVKKNRRYLTFAAVATSLFAACKFVEIASRHFTSATFIFGLVFVVILLLADRKLFAYIRTVGSDDNERSKLPSGSEEPLDNRVQASGQTTREEHRRGAAGAASSLVTIVGIFIGSFSVIALVSLLVKDNFQSVLAIISLVAVLSMLFAGKVDKEIRYTILAVGFIGGLVSCLWYDRLWLDLVFLVLSAAAWYQIQGRFASMFLYLMIQINGVLVMVSLFPSDYPRETITFAVLAAINFLIYGLTASRIIPISRPDDLRHSAYLFGMIELFWLSFDHNSSSLWYYGANLIFFAVSTAGIFYSLSRGRTFEYRVSQIFWGVFLVFKYQEYFWKLLHKSATLFLLAILFLAATYLYERRKKIVFQESSVRKRWTTAMVGMLVILQAVVIAVQVGANETILVKGEPIKLEVTTRDSRSLFQGDYVDLKYAISEIPEMTFPAEHLNKKKIKVVLERGADGIHRFKQLAEKGYRPADGEVVINGVYEYGWIRYGIEHYYMEEGTGFDLQRDAKLAEVQVGLTGNAILLGLSPG